jgi:transcriptional regulator with XRE-family HTH domain
MTLEEMRLECGWSKLELAREAKVDFNTLQRALTGETITLNSAAKIARAISRGLGRTVHYQQIDGLNVKV